MEISLHLSKAQIHLIGLTRSTFLVATANADLEALPNRSLMNCAVKMWMSVGRETLQLIAARENLSNFLPDSNQDSATQLYVIDSEPFVALVKTRSLLKSYQLKGYTAEAELTYTTWPR